MSVLQGLFGVALLVGYVYVETHGMVLFPGNDRKPAYGRAGRGTGGGTGGVFLWGSGYRGGK